MSGRIQSLPITNPITANGQSSVATGFGDATQLRAQLNITGPVTGTTPSMTVVLEDSLDGTNWNQIGTFTAKTSTGREVISVTTPFADRIRARWTVTGTTPSFDGVSVIVAGQ